jgi:hypothetical protein
MQNKPYLLFRQEWCQTLMVQGFFLVLACGILYGVNTQRAFAYALGSLVMMAAYAVSALIHFKGPVAPNVGRVFRQAARAVVLRFAILIIGVMFTLRYVATVDWLFFMLGAVVTQQMNWVVPMWHAWKGKD